MNEVDPPLPRWWNARIDVAWQRSRAAAVRDWGAHRKRSSSMDAAIEEQALAFGHGARSAYADRITWDLASPRLRADWIGLGHVGPAAWDEVAEIIRHEWQRAAGPAGDAAPETVAAE